MASEIWLGIDGTNWVHALWHAMGGQHVLPAFLRRVRILGEHVQATRLLVAFDRRSFRHDLCENYKANRKEKDAGLVELLKEAETAATAVAVPVAEAGYEADDCLATLAVLGRAAQRRVVLASADKDLYQCLVDGEVSLVRKIKTSGERITDADWMTAWTLGEQSETAGLQPYQWADYQALVGESGDNVRGCPGWGPVTARAALLKCKSLEGMLANVWNVPSSQVQRDNLLRWSKRDMATTRRLVRLCTQVATVAEALR